MSGGAEVVAVVGLGYVGLPLAVAIAQSHSVIGFDIDHERIAELRDGLDRTSEIEPHQFTGLDAAWTDDPSRLGDATFVIVTVPTPIDQSQAPDLGPLRAASQTIARAIRPGTVVVFESTVYPGVTEEVCGPIIEKESGLRCGIDFTLGYSPERINPGDKTHTIDRVVKVVAGQDAETLDRMVAVYAPACRAGLHVAPSIKVAEAAKVIENTQRDLNIALMNELSLIFDRLGISTTDVLAAARTKWNFLPFAPGLVGGHCIGVDPYYLTHKAQAVGYHPEVILAGRRVNDRMGAFVASKTVKMLIAHGISPTSARVAVLGLTFKENVPDLRNSRVPDIVRELEDFGVDVLAHDPLASSLTAAHEYGISLASWPDPASVDCVILAVPHRWYLDRLSEIRSLLRPNAIVVDVKAAAQHELSKDRPYWAL